MESLSEEVEEGLRAAYQSLTELHSINSPYNWRKSNSSSSSWCCDYWQLTST